MNQHPLGRLVAWATTLSLADVPPGVVAHAGRIVRDTLGAMLAGSRQPEIVALAAAAPGLGGVGRARLIGTRLATLAPMAALVNGSAGVTLEVDEGNQFAVNHPAVHVLPALLALGEELDATGADVLVAFIAGYEVAVRVGAATHLRDAVHPFGTHAICGTAAGSARLLGLDAGVASRAVTLAAGMAIASSQQAANAGASVRNLATGLTNFNGLLAARLAPLGATPEPLALESVFGAILGDRFEPSSLDVDLGRDYSLTRNYFKVHACSRWNAAPIEATMAIMAAHPIAASDVASVTVWTFDPATRLSARQIANGYAARHSIPYNVAVRLVHGTNDLEAYEPPIVDDPQVAALAERVSVREDPGLTALLPGLRAARVEIRMRDGRRHTATCERPRGGFDNPLSEVELDAKFRRLAQRAIGPEQADALGRRALDLAGLASIRELLAGT